MLARSAQIKVIIVREGKVCISVCISPGPSPASTRDGVRDGVVGWPVQLEPTGAETRPLGRWLGQAGVWYCSRHHIHPHFYLGHMTLRYLTHKITRTKNRRAREVKYGPHALVRESMEIMPAIPVLLVTLARVSDIRRG